MTNNSSDFYPEVPQEDVDFDLVSNDGFILTEKWYKRLKWLVQVLLPAFGTLYFTLGNIWGFPAIEEVVGTFSVIGLFIGTTMGISNMNYRSVATESFGQIKVRQNGSSKDFRMVLDETPDTLGRRRYVTLEVLHED